jgi:hypothetical protein
MEKWAEIRRLVKVENRSKRSVCRQFGIHWDTLVKILKHVEPPGYRAFMAASFFVAKGHRKP